MDPVIALVVVLTEKVNEVGVLRGQIDLLQERIAELEQRVEELDPTVEVEADATV